MSTPTALPCGAWPSALTPELTAAGAVALSYVGATPAGLAWIEGRPAEQGRSALVHCQADGRVAELLGPEANVRSSVHEYGGTPWLAVGDRWLYAEFADQRLRLRDAQGATRVLTPEGCRYADGCASPDGRHVVMVREDHRSPGEPRNAVVLLDTDQTEDAGQVLYGDSDFVAWPRFSADGQRLAFIAWNHPDMPWDATRLMVGRLQGVHSMEGLHRTGGTDGTSAEGAAALTHLHTIAGGPGESVLEPRWASDGSLYFLSDRSGRWLLYRWADGHAELALDTDDHASLPPDAELGGPLWNLGLATYALTGDGRALLRIGRGTVDTLAVLDLCSRVLTPLALPSAQFVSFSCIGLWADGQAHALAATRDGLSALISLDLANGEHRVLRAAGAAPIPPAWVSLPQAISFSTQPGPEGQARSAHAWFYPPHHPQFQPQPGELPPLVVMLHGGPTAQSGPGYKNAVQFWTTRGFAVVDVNYGGSTGYGRAYRERLRGQWGLVDLQDAVAAVDHLVAQGRVDGQRVAIRGGSAGGFTVLSALAFTRRFAAGINYFGVADLASLAADTHKFESRYLDGLVAPLPEGLAVYQARSPVHHMGQCRAALITFQGSEDRAVPPQQSRDIVAAARAAGCPVAYLEFEGEGHGFRQGPHIVQALQAELVFLGRVFGYTPAGDLPPLAIDNGAALQPLAG